LSYAPAPRRFYLSDIVPSDDAQNAEADLIELLPQLIYASAALK
jgi:hypothetical protein